MFYSFANKERDLADILTTVIRDEPRFISNFNRVITCSMMCIVGMMISLRRRT